MTLDQLAASSGYPDLSYHNWLKALAERVSAKHVLEVGSYLGSTAVAILGAANKPSITLLDDLQLSDRGVLAANVPGDRVRQIVYGKDLVQMPKILKAFQDIDFVHLDADHRAYPLLGELICVHLFSGAKTIVVHDASDKYVKHGVAEFKRWYGSHWDIQEVKEVYSEAYLITRKTNSREQSNATTNLIVPPGIGDIAWVWQRLPEDFGDVTVQVCGGGPPRAVPFVDLLPGVIKAELTTLRFAWLRIYRIPYYADPRLFKGTSFPIEVNGFLEGDFKLGDVFPSVPVRYSLPLKIPQAMTQQAIQVASKYKNIVGLYSSSGPNNNWGHNDPRKWCESAVAIHRELKPGAIAIIGADFDRPYTDVICRCLKERRIPHIPVIGQHIGYVTELIRRMKALLAFPSGIGVIGSLVGTPTVMGMPCHLPKLQYKWVNPAAIQSKKFIHRPIDNLKQMTDTFLYELNMDRS